jgi:hypothetical protein
VIRFFLDRIRDDLRAHPATGLLDDALLGLAALLLVVAVVIALVVFFGEAK